MTRLPIKLMLFAIVCAVPAIAQETAVYEFDDFLDPRSLGTEFTDDEVLPGLRFFSTILSFGGASDYQERNELTEEDVFFAHLGWNYYNKESQWTMNLTALFRSEDVVSASSPPSEDLGVALSPDDPVALAEATPQIVADARAQIKYSRYGLNRSDENGEEFMSRWSLAWTVESTSGEPTHELSYSIDVGAIRDVREATGLKDESLGTIFFAFKSVPGGPEEYRITYLFQDVLWQSERRSRLKLRARLGGERTFNHWRWGSLRAELSLLPGLQWLRGLRMAVAPAYRFQSRGVDGGFGVEFSAIFDLPAITRMF